MAIKLTAKKGWIDIPDLEQATKKLSALVLIAHELSNSKADYGKSTLLHLLKRRTRTSIKLSHTKRRWSAK